MSEIFDYHPNNPHNNEELENNCLYCGEESEKDFCNRACYIANLND